MQFKASPRFWMVSALMVAMVVGHLWPSCRVQPRTARGQLLCPRLDLGLRQNPNLCPC